MRNLWPGNGVMVMASSLLMAAFTFGATPPQQDWRTALAQELPLLGHRKLDRDRRFRVPTADFFRD